MKLRCLAPAGPLLVALALASMWSHARAQEKTPAATRQYNAAVGLHNSGAYDLAAEEWTKFLDNYKIPA